MAVIKGDYVVGEHKRKRNMEADINVDTNSTSIVETAATDGALSLKPRNPVKKLEAERKYWQAEKIQLVEFYFKMTHTKMKKAAIARLLCLK